MTELNATNESSSNADTNATQGNGSTLTLTSTSTSTSTALASSHKETNEPPPSAEASAVGKRGHEVANSSDANGDWDRCKQQQQQQQHHQQHQQHHWWWQQQTGKTRVALVSRESPESGGGQLPGHLVASRSTTNNKHGPGRQERNAEMTAGRTIAAGGNMFHRSRVE
eukprot:CAMPEP_0172360786 /NCGR_PEP_ID=MMETSP1060-20121228/4752_1 /TAXON_ID=37318 /ORGANISM="Pseudo-nitzschia pungens, Strain cf. cingulata" /LENGTH=167 /DNA_ID=CAMNT_0013082867 /DNA_START=142 /DNA_END=644 /DNA_ORIENTATION=-